MDFKNWLIKNIGIGSSILLILVIIILFLGGDISSRTQEIQSSRQDLAMRLYSIESLASLQTDSEKAKELQEKLEDSLPPRDQLINFSDALEKMAKSNRLGFGFSFEREVSSTISSPGINNFTLTSDGSYSNFIRFLKSIEESKYFVGLEYVDLMRKGKNFGVVVKGKVFSR